VEQLAACDVDAVLRRYHFPDVPGNYSCTGPSLRYWRPNMNRRQPYTALKFPKQAGQNYPPRHLFYKKGISKWQNTEDTYTCSSIERFQLGLRQMFECGRLI
jgi:hypothetical protein